MAMKLVEVRKPRAARLAGRNRPFIASTKAFERLSIMPRTTASARWLIGPGQLLERFESAGSGSTQPRVAPDVGGHWIVAGGCARIDHTQHHLSRQARALFSSVEPWTNAPRRVSSFIMRVMIMCNTACTASSVGAGMPPLRCRAAP